LLDIDGRRRPVGAGLDLGAHEYREPAYLPLIHKRRAG